MFVVETVMNGNLGSTNYKHAINLIYVNFVNECTELYTLLFC